MRGVWIVVSAFAAALGSSWPPSAFAGDDGAPIGGAVVVLRAEKAPADAAFRWLPDWRAPAAPRWAFALGGGAAWGLAHIGLLEAAADDGMLPDLIAGTSAGALVGSFLAAGYAPDEIERLFRSTDWNQVLSHPPRRQGLAAPPDPLTTETALYVTGRQRGGTPLLSRGIVPDRAVDAELFRLLARPGAIAGGDLDRLALPFRAVSVDLISGTVYAPRQGSLTTLVRASIGLPVFRPVALGSRVLVDGGVLENVPAPTARDMGAQAVIAVRLSAEGGRLDSPSSLASFGGVLGRSYDVVFASQREQALSAADAVLDIAVKDASLSEFHDQLGQLIQIGRAAWTAHRAQVLAALEQKARDRRTFTVRTVEAAPGVDAADADALSRRLGLATSPQSTSALRLELELARTLRRGGHPDGHLELHPDGRLVLVLEPPEVVRQLALECPPSLSPECSEIRLSDLGPDPRPAAVLAAIAARVLDARRRGLFLCGIEAVSWAPAARALRVTVGDGTLAGLEIRSAQTGETIAPSAALDALAGRPATTAGVVAALVDSFQRGDISDVSSVDAVRRPDGRFLITALVAPPPLWEAAANLGASDALGAVLWGRVSWPSLLGWKRWGLELRAVGGRQGAVVAAEGSPPGQIGRQSFARVVAARAFVPRYSPGGDLIASRGFWSGTVAAGLRTRRGPLGVVELAVAGRFLDRAAFADQTAGNAGELTLDAAWRGDRRDSSAQPTRGAAWSIEGVAPVAGARRAWVVRGDFWFHVPLDARARWSAALLGQASEAEHGRPLPLDRWTDPGGWMEAPQLLPGRGLSPTVRRGGLVLRKEVGALATATITVGASAAIWRLGQERIDPSVDREGRGYSAFLEARTARFGPLIVGAAHGSLEGNTLFLLFGPYRFPWPGPLVELPGR